MTDEYSLEERDAMVMKAMTRETGDKLNEMLESHEKVIHDGESCPEERVNTIAYLAHRVGVRNRYMLWMLIKRIEDYEDYHHEHPHS